MSDLLPRLRNDIDVLPSPLPDQPGLLMRDPFLYTEHILVIPPTWVVVLQCLDGTHSALDAQAILTRLAGGQIVTREEVEQFVSVLDEAGYIESAELDARKEHRREEFRRANVREATHAGSAYPAEREAIETLFAEHMPGAGGADGSWPLAIAAPHVSPEGGFASYQAAYQLPPPENAPTFAILGTSHYGAPERFGTSAKSFETPLGSAEVDADALAQLVDAAGDAVVEEDYCHRAEHSIELQVLFLQYQLRRPIKIVPILCGPFADSLRTGNPPETIDGNRRVFDALAELHAKRDDLVWVLGVDMAHIGNRYGHREAVRAGEGLMEEVAAKDRARLERWCEADAGGFFDLVHPGGDELNWCGYAPMYTFLQSVGAAVKLRGELRSYEQWNIDEGSVVSFGAVHFRTV